MISSGSALRLNMAVLSPGEWLMFLGRDVGEDDEANIEVINFCGRWPGIVK